MSSKWTRGGHRANKKRSDFSKFVNFLIDKSERDPSHPIQINKLASEHGVEKRRLYDLMNVLVACDICVKTDSHIYRWLTVRNARSAVQRISKENELKAITIPISDLLTLPDSPSIGLMTSTFISAFVLFNVTIMNIREVAILLSSAKNHPKPILRRLYLVAFLLERVGLLRHRQKVGDYEIDVNIEETCLRSIRELAREGLFPPYTVEHYLSRIDAHFIRVLFRERERCLVALRQQKGRIDEGDQAGEKEVTDV